MMNAMGVKAKFVLTVFLLTTASILVLGSFQWYRYAQDLENQFIRESISNANVLADIVRRYIQESSYEAVQLQEILMMEGKFYAQIVKEEKVIFVSGDSSLIKDAPEPRRFSERLWVEKKFLSNGTPYLDMKRVLDLVAVDKKSASASYVRLGYSMVQLSGQINAQLWQNMGVGLIILCIVTVGAYFLASAWFNPSKIATIPAPAATVSAPKNAQIFSDENHNQTPSEGILVKIHTIEINEKSKQVHRAGEHVNVSPREFALLRLLASDPGRVFSNEEILKQAWGENSYLTAEDVKKYVYQLRQKLELDPENPKLIVTIRGFGYKISSN